MINMHSKYPYIIKLTVNKKHRQYNAILRALQDTKFLTLGRCGSYYEAALRISSIQSLLENVTYRRRNTEQPLDAGYNIVGSFAGKDYACDPCGYFDKIEVRSIHSNQVVITYEIAEDTPPSKKLKQNIMEKYGKYI